MPGNNVQALVKRPVLYVVCLFGYQFSEVSPNNVYERPLVLCAFGGGAGAPRCFYVVAHREHAVVVIDQDRNTIDDGISLITTPTTTHQLVRVLNDRMPFAARADQKSLQLR